MSLVIAKNGKIQSYFHKELSGVSKTFKSNYAKEVSDFDQLNITSHNNHDSSARPNKQAFNSYGKSSKDIKKTRSIILVKDIMSSPLVTFKPDKSISRASEDMDKFNKRHYPIVEDSQILGIVSKTDILKAQAKQLSPSTPIKDIMSHEVILVKSNTDIRIVSKIMIEEDISSLPVVNDHNLLIGIITKTDLLKCIVNNMPIDCFI